MDEEKNQKLDNQLNLAMELTEEERLRSGELAVGYDARERLWEVIVKYSGSLDEVRSLGAEVEELLNEYAILRLPQRLVDKVSSLPQIEYVEKPKRLFFALNRARSVSCIDLLQETDIPEGRRLTGRGVLVAVPDSGIDYFHEAFRNADGTTRIAALWDQEQGRVYSRYEINEALAAGSRKEALALVPSVDAGGHGTAVAGIAAGSGLEGGSNAASGQAVLSGGREGAGSCRGIAYESDLLIIKLAGGDPQGFPRTTQLMRAVNFAVEQAIQRNQPLALNLSFGNTYGPHDGSSLLETFLDDIGNLGRTVIVVGSGNEGAAAGHTSGRFLPDGSGREAQIRFSVALYETAFSVQLWKSYADQFSVSLQTPSGERFGPFPERLDTLRFRYRGTQILVYYGKPGPYSVAQEIYFDFIPDAGEYVESGIWSLLLEPQHIVLGQYDCWLPSSSVLNADTQFLEPSPETTLTIPSAASRVITVGAYDAATRVYADFSGRGYTWRNCLPKPDLLAPGVGILAPASGGGCQPVTGTSFAAPVVTGSAALLMQWGIRNGKDPFLYGEKLKACLQRGARPLPAFSEYPNPQAGYGALCVRDSLPSGF